MTGYLAICNQSRDLSFLKASYTWLVAQTVKNMPARPETWFDPWVGKIAWRRAWQPTPVSLSIENPVDRGALVGADHGITKSQI